MSRLIPWKLWPFLISYLIVLSVGLRYLFNTGLMPYHYDFIGDSNLNPQVETLITMGLRMIGACFIALAIQGIRAIIRGKLGMLEFGMMFLVGATTGLTTYIVGYTVGTLSFAGICLLQLSAFFIAFKQNKISFFKIRQDSNAQSQTISSL